MLKKNKKAQKLLSKITMSNAKTKKFLKEIDKKIVNSDLDYAKLLIKDNINILKQTKKLVSEKNSLIKTEEKELIQNLKTQAGKLALLLYSSNMPNNVKKSWAAILPEMSLKQIEKLLNVLEAKYLDEQTKNIDKEYEKKIKKIVENSEKEKEDSKNNFLKSIDKFKKNLKI